MSLCTYACTRSINQIRVQPVALVKPLGFCGGQIGDPSCCGEAKDAALGLAFIDAFSRSFKQQHAQDASCAALVKHRLCASCEYSVVRPPSTLSLSSVSFNLRLPAGEREQRSGKEDQDVPCTVYEWGARGVLSSSARRRSCSAALDLPPRSVQELAVVDGSRQAAVHGAHLLDDGGLRSQGCRPRPGDLTGWDETSSLPSHNRTPPVPLLHQISPKFLARY